MAGSLEAMSLSDNPFPRVSVSSTVVFNILNSFCRRTALSNRIVGTLLGEYKDGCIHVTECFVVPFKESIDSHMISLGVDYHTAMYAFHRRNNRKEVVVGWFATATPAGALLVDNSALVHEFYTTQCDGRSPVHLVVDTSLATDSLKVRGFLSRENILGSESLSSSFHEVRVDITASDVEASILHHLLSNQPEGRAFASSSVYAEMKRAGEDPVEAAKARVSGSVQKLVEVVDKLQQYVEQVISGDVEANREIGLLLTEAVNAFVAQTADASSLSPVQLNTLTTRAQDLLMIAYLSVLTKTQTTIAEKINQLL